jgi:hypothetical protein
VTASHSVAPSFCFGFGRFISRLYPFYPVLSCFARFTTRCLVFLFFIERPQGIAARECFAFCAVYWGGGGLRPLGLWPHDACCSLRFGKTAH